MQGRSSRIPRHQDKDELAKLQLGPPKPTQRLTSFREKNWQEPLKPPRRRSPTSAARAGYVINLLQSKGPKFFAKLAALVAVVGIAASVVLFVIPFAHPISGQISLSLCAKCPIIPQPYVGYGGESFPVSSNVVINWQSASSSLVNFTIYNPNTGYRLGHGCDERGISGTCSFIADGGAYASYVRGQTTDTITWSGSYTGPLIQRL